MLAYLRLTQLAVYGRGVHKGKLWFTKYKA